MSQNSLVARAWKASKAAIPIWLVLTLHSEIKGRTRFTVKRALLGRVCGIRRLPTISAGLAALHNLKIIERKVRICRRPDGTLFHKLRVHLKRRITKSVLDQLTQNVRSSENRISKSVRGDTDRDTKSVRIHRVQKTGYSQSTAPGYGKRNHLPGTPEYVKRNTSLRDGGTRLTAHTHSAPADAAGALRCAEAARTHATGAEGFKFPAHWKVTRDDIKQTIQQLCTQIGCAPEEFIEEDGIFVAITNEFENNVHELVVFVDQNRGIEVSLDRYDENTESDEHIPWIGSPEQISLIQQRIQERKKNRPWGWLLLTTATRTMAIQTVEALGCSPLDFQQEKGEPEFLTLGCCENIGDTWLTIDPDGKRLVHTLNTEDEADSVPWTGSAEQIATIRKSIACQSKNSETDSSEKSP